MNSRQSIGLLSLAVSILAVACGPGQDREAITSHDEVVARLISDATAGLVAPGQPIRVRFADSMVSGSLPRELSANPFDFDPGITGTVSWTDPRTVELRPERRLEHRREYRGSLDLSALWELSDVDGRPPVATFEMAFETMGPEVLDLEDGWESSSDGARVRYWAEVAFTVPIDEERLQRALQARLDGRNVPLQLDILSESSARISSEWLDRGPRPQELTVGIQSRPLDLSDDVAWSLTIPAAGSFAVDRIWIDDSAGSPVLSLRFSQRLSNQDLQGLIRVEPATELSLDVQGETVLARGNLNRGERYTVVVGPGITSHFGDSTTETVTQSVEVADLKPRMEFLSGGVFLPSTNSGSVFVRTVNLRAVDIEIKQVFENNLGQFLQTESMTGAVRRNQEFGYEYVSRVGVVVAEESLEIGEHPNRWLLHEINLSTLMENQDAGLFLLSISFEREDMIYDMSGSDGPFYGDDYYNDPRSWGYLWNYGRIFKPVMPTDLGLTWKQGESEHTVFVTDLRTGAPIEGATVSVRTYQNQVIAEGKTNDDGVFRGDAGERVGFYVLAEHAGQQVVAKANEMAWNLSTFDVGGRALQSGGLDGYLFTERGVYRPGDDVHLSGIFRLPEGPLPDDHPVQLEVSNSLGQLAHRAVQSEGTDGVYAFTIPTGKDDPTGTWRGEVTVGDATFGLPIRIETIVPERIAVELRPAPPVLTPKESYLDLGLSARYLFGAPASNLATRVEAVLRPRNKSVSGFPGFAFQDAASRVQPFRETIFDGQLTSEGKARIGWELPTDLAPPSALALDLSAVVSERGGRSSREQLTIPVEPYETYVGLEMPDFTWGYAPLGEELTFRYVAVADDGRAVTGRPLEYRLFQNRGYWWWEYDSYDAFRVRYREDETTVLVEEGRVLSRATAAGLTVLPQNPGEYLLEVTDPNGGHRASLFFRVSAWADAGASGSEAVLSVSGDKERYAPGDVARISMATPESGRMLVTVEKDAELLSYEWTEATGSQTVLEIPIDASYVPNVYVTVSLIQRHDQTANDQPLRLYGVIPLRVEDPATKAAVSVEIEETIRPESPFTVSVTVAPEEQSQVLVAVVDEGLLSLTDHSTPDPWSHFFGKRRLAMESYDTLSEVIGAFQGDVFRVFSLGGGDEAKPLSREAGSERRFEPVSLFQGPVTTDSRGRATVHFDMPNYLGAVRVMAVAVSPGRYGSAAETVEVSRPVVALPTLPRTVGPGERVSIPISLFRTSSEVAEATVSIHTDDLLQVDGPDEVVVVFDDSDSTEVLLTVATAEAIGTAVVTLSVDSSAGGYSIRRSIPLRASSPPLRESREAVVEVGATASMSFPAPGIEGTNRATLTVSQARPVNLETRMAWLLQYPYGCLEQTVSSAFAQLFVPRAVDTSVDTATIDKNVNGAIERMRSFRLPSGAFSYWPGNPEPSLWVTNYAGHFLIEAKALGYYVPQNLIDGWLRFQLSRALTTADSLKTRVYRLYLLALAGEPALGPMNLIRENAWSELDNVDRWLLAGAYHLAGYEEQAGTLLSESGTDVAEYREFGGTYGSTLRDLSMILEVAVATDHRRVADRLFDTVSGRLATDRWYSTQTTGYALLATARYLTSLERPAGAGLRGRVVLPGGETREFESVRSAVTLDLTGHLYESTPSARRQASRTVTVEIADAPSNRVFVTGQWEGQPVRPRGGQVSEGLGLSSGWYDTDGRPLDATNVPQGTEFWQIIRVSHQDPVNELLEELACTQIYPAGWEIVNPRISGQAAPWWMEGGTSPYEYLDIRDDRVSWFFDLSRGEGQKTFAMRLRAVLPGEFGLPSVSAQAMYRDDVQARLPGQTVEVRRP